MIKFTVWAALAVAMVKCHDRETIILTHKKFDADADGKVTRKQMREGIMDDLNGKEIDQETETHIFETVNKMFGHDMKGDGLSEDEFIKIFSMEDL